MQRLTDPHEAAKILARGELVALPTETVYGLAARADQPSAVARMYAAKGRPADHPVIVHVASAAALSAWARDVPEYALALADAFWPGPMTLVVHRSETVGDWVTGGQDTVGIRVPNHPLFLATLAELAELVNVPEVGLAAPSANRFGRVSPTSADHVLREFNEAVNVGVLDGGSTTVGVESTIVDCTGAAPMILRNGAVTAADIERVTGIALIERATSTRAPGTLASHYAPNARVVLATETGVAVACQDILDAHRSVGLLAQSHVPTPANVVRLSEPMNAEQYAAVLYASLREADALELEVIVAVPPLGNTGLEPAILDRLTRAAHQ